MKWLLFGAMLLTSNLYAESQSILVPTGGLDTTNPSFRVDPKYSPYFRNVTIDNGSIKGINGYVTLGSTFTLKKVTGMFPFVRETGVTTFLVTDSSVTLETSDFKTWVLVSSVSNPGTLMTWMQVRNKMWGFNGVDSNITWDGTTKVTLNGSGTTPNVPKFRYGAYWQERVWGFNDSVSASNLDFSSVVTTDAVIINPDDNRAWPSTNQLKIGQGDGELGTALWVERGQLRCGKERSKHTIYGTSVSNYFARKDVTNSVGVISNESVVQMDNDVYYLAGDGIYKGETRISDMIEDDVNGIDKGVQKVVNNVWDTQNDFAKGNFSGGSTATAEGILKTATQQYGTFIFDSDPVDGGHSGFYVRPSGVLDGNDVSSDLTTGTTFYGPKQLTFASSSIPPYSKVFIRRVLWAYADGAVVPCVQFSSLTVTNRLNGEIIKSTASAFNTGGDGYIHFPFYFQNPLFEGYDVLNSSLEIKIEGCRVVTQKPSDGLYIEFVNSTTGQYVSEVATATSVTAWGNFNSVYNTNGGDIKYFFHTSTSVVNIATKTWANINPGVIIGEPLINNYFQWATTITNQPIMAAASTTIDNVEIGHVEGIGSVNRAFGIQWKNRYWLATTTDSSSNFSLIYVKSKVTNENPNAFMPIEGINISSLMKNNDVLYGGSSSTGSVYRLDYGTNFDGTAIPFIYDIPDLLLGSNYMSKDLQMYLLDAKKYSGLSYSLGTSIDGGAFSYKSIPYDGSGRKLYVVKGVTQPCKTVRLRISHSQLDKPFEVYDLTVVYSPSNVLEPK